MRERICSELVGINVCFFLYSVNLNILGDPDENVYIVQSGKLCVFITGTDGNNTLKIVKPGESVTSLLSFTDVLTVRTSFVDISKRFCNV